MRTQSTTRAQCTGWRSQMARPRATFRWLVTKARTPCWISMNTITKGEKALVVIRPEPPFLSIFQGAVTRDGSMAVLLKEEDLPPPIPKPTEVSRQGSCSWWRRGGVDLSLKTPAHRLGGTRTESI